MRDSFVRSLLELAKADKNVELITGDLGFGVLQDLVDPFVAFLALGQNIDPFAPAVRFVRPELDELLLFQPGQQARHGGMTQMKGLLQVLGAGGRILMGKISHDMSLGCS